MKILHSSLSRTLSVALIAATSLSAFTPSAEARDPGRPGIFGGLFGGRSRGHPPHHHHDDARRRFLAHPRSTFVLSFGTGYAGTGYYYGPPNASYYYEAPGVVYYSHRDRVPPQYRHYPAYRNHRSTVELDVQRELARRGYYRGPIDGAIGPGSRQAIVRYQRDRGLRPTGVIDSVLLRSLGL